MSDIPSFKPSYNGPIYGPLTERESALVDRAYMGAILAKEIIDSVRAEEPFYYPANRATHICQPDCECDARLDKFRR